MKTPESFAAQLSSPCPHQLDAAEGAFIVPTCRIRARDCDRCVVEVLREAMGEAIEAAAKVAAYGCAFDYDAGDIGCCGPRHIAADIRALALPASAKGGGDKKGDDHE